MRVSGWSEKDAAGETQARGPARKQFRIPFRPVGNSTSRPWFARCAHHIRV